MFFNKYQLLLSSIIAWAAAQIIKTIIDFRVNHKFNPERFIGTGGMPSSHSSTVSALATASLLKYGLSSFEFAISFIFAIIVEVDAMGVRLETGKQAKLLNVIIEENILRLKDINPEQRFKELIGHTPLQVIVGSVLGIFIALVISAFC